MDAFSAFFAAIGISDEGDDDLGDFNGSSSRPTDDNEEEEEEEEGEKDDTNDNNNEVPNM